ncbi:PREDICTED: voltage-gated hydrogen channel 1-like [Priapulus caudatus]|uniref:Voltage-gated hydrogen channel 1 n=1 Tax=Priapulus caudatus TaxID=37621 RepID=A0ABM1E756_PRICU|nr:PREDICTED: voltage-gated hydrogen channel 1-like [Priapulus caudatus]
MKGLGVQGFKKVSEDLEKVIVRDDATSMSTVESEEDNFRTRMPLHDRVNALIHGQRFQIFIVVLVIIDVLLVIAELLVDLKVFEMEPGDSGEDASESAIGEVLHYASLAILSLFMVEIVVKLYAMRLSFFKHKLEMFDAVVVVVAFSLDIAFTTNKGGAVNGLNLLVILRLWRIARIVNGIILSMTAQAEKRLHREKREREAVEDELGKFREFCARQTQEIERLRDLLELNGISAHKVERTAFGSQLQVVAEVNDIITSKKLEADT